MSGRLDVSEKLRIDRPPVLHSMYIFSLQFILILRVPILTCLRAKERVEFRPKEECVREICGASVLIFHSMFRIFLLERDV